jgi:hypothetical protein
MASSCGSVNAIAEMESKFRAITFETVSFEAADARAWKGTDGDDSGDARVRSEAEGCGKAQGSHYGRAPANRCAESSSSTRLDARKGPDGFVVSRTFARVRIHKCGPTSQLGISGSPGDANFTSANLGQCDSGRGCEQLGDESSPSRAYCRDESSIDREQRQLDGSGRERRRYDNQFPSSRCNRWRHFETGSNFDVGHNARYAYSKTISKTAPFTDASSRQL